MGESEINMKRLLSIIIILAFLILAGCSTEQKKEEEATPRYTADYA